MQIADGIISSSADYSLYRGLSKIATVQDGEFRVLGDLIAENYIVSSSVTNIEYQSLSGSTIFGDSADDTHTFLGNTISGSATSTGSFGAGYIDSYLGFNTTAPEFPIDIKLKPANAASGIVIRDDDGTIIHKLGKSPADHGQYRIFNGSGTQTHHFDANDNSYINVGNVGIGTTNPGQKLEVAGKILINNGSGTHDLYLANTSYGIHLVHSTGVMNFVSNGSTRMSIANGEDVSIVSDLSVGGNIVSTAANAVISGSATSTGSFGRTSTDTLDLNSIQGNWTNAGNTVADLGTITTADINGGTINGITDLAVVDGGTGVSTLTDGGILLGSGTDAITAAAVLGDGEILIGDNSGDPVALDIGSSTAITILGTIGTGVWEGDAINDTYIGTIDNVNKVALTALDIDGGTAIDAIADADLMILDDGANGTNTKATMSQLKTYMSGLSGGSTLGNVQVGITTANTIDVTGDTFHIGDNTVLTGSLTTSGNISGSATSTGSFGQVHAADKIGVMTTTPGSVAADGFNGTKGIIEIRAAASGADAALLIRRFEGDGVYGMDLWTDTNSADNYIDSRSGITQSRLFIRVATHTSTKNAAIFDYLGNVEFPTATSISGSATSTGSFGGVFSAGKSRFMGNVGIGDTNPTMNLSVQDDAPTVIINGTNTGDGAGNARLYLLAGNQSDAFIRFTRDNSGNDWAMGLDHSDSQKFKISDNGTLGTNDRLVIDTSGNVAFTGDITVEDIGASIKLMESGDNAYFATLSSFHNAGDSFSLVGIKGDYLKHIRTDDSDENTHTLRIGGAMKRVDIFSNGNQRLLIDQDGKVGIGTASPETALHISNNAAPADDLILLTLQNGNGTGDIGTPNTFIDFVFKDSNTNVTPQARIGAHAGDGTDASSQPKEGKGYLTFHTSDTTNSSGVEAPPERMRIANSGNLGIGTTSPATPLHVSSSDNILAHFQSSDNNASIKISDNNAVSGNIGSEGGIMYMGARDSAHADNLNINVSGDVGIGNLDPQTKLDVTGTIQASGNISGSSTSTGSFGTLHIPGKFILDSTSRISLSNNDSGTGNTVFGKNAGVNIDAGSNYNVFIGEDVGDGSLNDAQYNTGVGWNAMSTITTGDYNTAVGAVALKNTNTGEQNVAMGYKALFTNSTGDNNVAIGHVALHTIAGADNNTAVGTVSGYSVTTASGSAFLGYQAGRSVSTGNDNIAIGNSAMYGGTVTGDNNIAIGASAGDAITSGKENVLIGADAGGAVNSATDTVAVGHNTLSGLTTGAQNVAIGAGALRTTDDGQQNTAIGHASMALGNVGGSNTAVGGQTLLYVTGNNNTAVGMQASQFLVGGAYNVSLGIWAARYVNGSATGNVSLGAGALMNAKEGASNADVDYNIAIGYQAMMGGTLAADNDLIGNIAIGYNAFKSTGTQNHVGTIAIGYNALTAVTSGSDNVAIGYEAGKETTIGDNNVYIGYRAAYRTAGLNNQNNVFIGYYAGSGDWTSTLSSKNTAVGSLSMTGAMNSAVENTAVGYRALNAITTADSNTAIGVDCGDELTDGHNNVAIGAATLGTSTSVGFATAVGQQAMGSGDVTAAADGTVAIGYKALMNLTTGAGNTAVGNQAGAGVVTGFENTYIGTEVGSVASASSANYNTGVGHQALRLNISGSRNVAIGRASARQMVNGSDMVAIGYGTLANVLTSTDSDGTIAIGSNALIELTDGQYNLAIGHNAGVALTTSDYNILIGADAGLEMVAGSSQNTIIGYKAFSRTGGGASTNNTYIGWYSGGGDHAGTSTYNVGVGEQTLYGAHNGVQKNSALGWRALYSCRTGDNNVGIGYQAGHLITTGGGHVIIGSDSAPSAGNTSNEIVIGYNATGLGTNTAVIGNTSLTDIYMSQDAGATVHAAQLIVTGPTNAFDTIKIIGDAEGNVGNAGIVFDLDNSTDDAEAYLRLDRTAGTAFLGLTMQANARDGMRFMTDTTERLKILHNGNVGIGTSDINWTGLGVDHTVLSVGNPSAGMGMLELSGKRTSTAELGRLVYGNDTTRVAEIVAKRTDANNSADLLFKTMNAGSLGTRLTIADDGKVGIGTATPAAPLHINTTANAITGTSVDVSNIQFKILNPANDNQEAVGIGFALSTNNENIGAAIIHNRDGAESEGNLHFATKAAGEAGAADIPINMTLDSSGKLGIGTTSPGVALEVIGSISGSATSTGSFGTINLNGNENARPLFVREGNNAVGMGTSSPTATRLHAYSGTATSTGLVKFEAGESTVDNGDVILILDFSADSSIGNGNDYIQFQDSGGEVGRIHSEVSYGTFTGTHVSQRPSGSSYDDWKPGMIVKSTGNILATGSSMALAWPEVELTTTQKDKAVMGVWEANNPSGSHNDKYLDRTLPRINYNAVGEGRIRVTDTGGNIETGDYICSSTRTGHGEKQDDDLLHNYTVAKATQPYNFASASNDSDLGYKSVLIACTYHCG